MLTLICTDEAHAAILPANMDIYTRIYTWSCNHAESQTIQHNLLMCQHCDFLFIQPVPWKQMYSPGYILQAAAQKVQKRLLNKPRHPAQLVADIVERVVATGGEPYLDTQAQTLSWWQLSLLDVKLFLAVVVTALLCGLGGLLWLNARVLLHVGRKVLGSTHRKTCYAA